jgi:hypothetical protein
VAEWAQKSGLNVRARARSGSRSRISYAQNRDGLGGACRTGIGLWCDEGALTVMDRDGAANECEKMWRASAALGVRHGVVDDKRRDGRVQHRR